MRRKHATPNAVRVPHLGEVGVVVVEQLLGHVPRIALDNVGTRTNVHRSHQPEVAQLVLSILHEDVSGLFVVTIVTRDGGIERRRGRGGQ